jgi:hypothetical protein
MQKVSAKKLSVLGLVLMAASALTAAIVPNSSNKILSDGTLKDAVDPASNDGGNVVNTCIPRSGANSCNVTAGTKSSTAGEGVNGQSTVTVDVDKVQTANNTTAGDI